jgi:hypothetical protein
MQVPIMESAKGANALYLVRAVFVVGFCLKLAFLQLSVDLYARATPSNMVFDSIKRHR